MKRSVKFVVRSLPDERGRQRFDVEWYDGRPRGQCFNAVMQPHVDRTLDRGDEVVIVDGVAK